MRCGGETPGVVEIPRLSYCAVRRACLRPRWSTMPCQAAPLPPPHSVNFPLPSKMGLTILGQPVNYAKFHFAEAYSYTVRLGMVDLSREIGKSEEYAPNQSCRLMLRSPDATARERL